LEGKSCISSVGMSVQQQHAELQQQHGKLSQQRFIAEMA
jgi:hypothetical protein